ncbi:MAG TPA: NAD(P)H-dependent oxidoreductase subunit E [Candidatus Megaira endosymbiont of Hartmannula sinica]|nr:NAD(P)H-dependent oxidoreductase subunit E [Candidatus Megaera endosymbiont of Hartmannula sinica]
MKNKFTFSEENLKKVTEILEKYPKERQKSAVIPLLDLAQRQNKGYINSSIIEYIAGIIKQPYIKIYEIVSFYSMFYDCKVGKYNLQICTTTPCWLKDQNKKIINKIIELTAINYNPNNNIEHNTSRDKLFSITEVECLGACINAPIIQINDDYMENVTVEKISSWIKKVKKEENI